MSVLGKLANGRNIIILLVLFLLFNLVVIPAIYPKFETLDIMSTYTPAQAYEHLSSYGDAGRQLYLLMEVTLDIIYPFISALLFSLLILYAFQRGFPSQTWTHKLALLPFAVMLVDYLENASVVTMLVSFPRQLPTVASIANIFTVTKFALSWFELVFIVGLIGWLVRVLRRRISPSSAS